MSGHSKWSTIKHKKGATDAKRGKLFSQLAKNIRVAVKQGNSDDPNANPALRLAMDKARAANMPNDNIRRAIDRAMGVGKGESLQEIVYEGYGAGGVGFLLIVVTDNKMRTAAEVRSIFDKNGGSLGGPGAAAYLFDPTGEGYSVKIPVQIDDQQTWSQVEKLEEALLEHEDVEEVYHNAVSSE